MPDFFELSAGDQGDVLETAAQTLGRPAYVLEKDIYVVWVLGRIFLPQLVITSPSKAALPCRRSIA